MASIFLCEPEARYRTLLRYILEGVHHSVTEAGGYAEVPGRLAAGPADLIVLGAHLEDGDGPWRDPDWQRGLPRLPLVLLCSGGTEARQAFLGSWQGPPGLKLLAQPVEPYPFLATVKSMLTSPETWRRGGQHSV